MQGYAHTDATSYDLMWLNSTFIKCIFFLCDSFFAANEVNLFLDVTRGLLARITVRIEEIRQSGV